MELPLVDLGTGHGSEHHPLAGNTVEAGPADWLRPHELLLRELRCRTATMQPFWPLPTRCRATLAHRSASASTPSGTAWISSRCYQPMVCSLWICATEEQQVARVG